MIQILLLRHGMTDWNAQKLLQGRSDIPLSKDGVAQVESWMLEPHFHDHDWVCSPLQRARQTARILGHEARIEPALIEMSWGDWEGQNFAKLRRDLGQDMLDNFAKGLDFRPTNGESPRDVQTRLKPWLADLTRPTVAVCHRGVLQALHALAADWPMIGTPPHKLQKWGAHLFHIDQGRPLITQLNLPLAPPSRQPADG